MGEYFTPTFLNTAGQIVAALDPGDYGSGLKLAGHTRTETRLMHAVLTLLALDGGLRVVWAGDYADDEPGHDANLYFLIEDRHFVRFAGLVTPDITPNKPLPQGRRIVPSAGYICNFDKRQYIDNAALPVDHSGSRRSPLPSLAVESERTTPNPQNFGAWARDRLHYQFHHPGPGWSRSC